MSKANIINKTIEILPNDFNISSSHATIEDISLDLTSGLLKLKAPYQYNHKAYRYVVARARGTDAKFDELLRDGKLDCNLYWISVDLFDISKPFDVSWWRGGAAAITTIKLI